jgi:hypothetical protein
LGNMQTDGGEKMRRPIIKAAVEEACSKSSGHWTCGKGGGNTRED